MEPKDIDSYGEWVIRNLQEETGFSCLPAELIGAARLVWPRVAALVTIELKGEGGIQEGEALAAEIWEGVLRSVARAAQRNADYGASIRDPESYLLVAFRHRFHRYRKADRGRRDVIQSANASLDLGIVESARDTTWVFELERAITVRQITERMDAWTRKVLQARQYGYSWKEIAAWSGLSQQAAKKKFEYGLEKTRQRILLMLDAGAAKKT